jgi:hypothetical protein
LRISANSGRWNASWLAAAAFFDRALAVGVGGAPLLQQHADAAQHRRQRRRHNVRAEHGDDVLRALRVALPTPAGILAQARLAVGVHDARLGREAAQIFAGAGAAEKFRARAKLGVDTIGGGQCIACVQRRVEVSEFHQQRVGGDKNKKKSGRQALPRACGRHPQMRVQSCPTYREMSTTATKRSKPTSLTKNEQIAFVGEGKLQIARRSSERQRWHWTI